MTCYLGDLRGRTKDGEDDDAPVEEVGSLDTVRPAEALGMANTAVPESMHPSSPLADGSALGQTALANGSALEQTALANASNGEQTEGPLVELQTIPKNHYRAGRELARGGMGRIIEAQDLRLGRPVAIKELLNPTPSARARFEREAMITACLQHPVIVPLYEAGCWPDGEPFFAMKMVAGSPLDEVVRECKTRDERLALLPRVIDVADALAYAHSRGVIHRDLKPANVLVGDFGETVVIDWGLAKRVDAEEEDALAEGTEALVPESSSAGSDLTVLGQAMGTPAYMPPEQARGHEVDKRADVYSLGAMLYHLLSGRVAYARSKSAAEVLSKVLEGPPEPLKTVAQGIPDDLLTIVNKAMAREVEDRYEDAEVFAEELRRFESGKLVAAHRYSAVALFARWLRRHRVVVLSAGLMLCTLTAFAVWSFQNVRRERDRAMQAQKRALHERRDAEAKSQELALNLASGLTAEHPLEALSELAKLKDLGASHALIERAREIAAQAYSNRIPSELTSAGSDHGVIALSPDDRLVAIAWHDSRVALLNLQDKSVRLLPGPGFRSIRELAFSPGGTRLAAAGVNETVVLWSMEEQAAPTVITTRRGVVQIEFSPDERWMALRRSGSAVVVDLHRDPSQESSQRRVPLFYAKDIAFSPDSSTLAVAADHALLFDLASGEVTKVVPGKPAPHTSAGRHSFAKVLYSPAGESIVFADERIVLVDAASRDSVELFAATEQVTALSFSSDGRTLAAGSLDKIIYVYQLDAEGTALHSLTGHEEELSWVAFAGDSRELVSAGDSGRLRLWHLSWIQDGNILWSTTSETLSASLGQRVPVLTHDSSRLLAYDRNNVLRLWDRKRPGLQALGEERWGSRAQFSIGERLMAWTGGGNDLTVRLANTEGHSQELGRHGEQIEVLTLSPDDRYVASGGAKRLVLWDIEQQSSTDLVGHKSHMRFASFAGDKLITADFRGNIFEWQLPEGQGRLIAEHGDMLNGMVGVCMDPGGGWIATAGLDKKVFLHDLERGKKRLIGTADWPVRGMAATRDGDRLAMSLHKGEITIFSPRSDEEPVVLRSPGDMEELLHPAFSPDGRALAATNGVTGIRVWIDWRQGAEARFLRGRHESSFPTFSPDGKRIVAPGKPQGLSSVWQLETGQRRDLQGYQQTGKAAFWPRSNRIVVSSWGGLVDLWQDDLPRDWKSLHHWIVQQLHEHRSLPGMP